MEGFGLNNSLPKIEERLPGIKGQIAPSKFEYFERKLKWIKDMQQNCGYEEFLKEDLNSINDQLDKIEHLDLPSMDISDYAKNVRKQMHGLKERTNPLCFEHYENNVNWVEEMQRKFGYDKLLERDLSLIQYHLDRIEETPKESKETTEIIELVEKVDERMHDMKERMQPSLFDDYHNALGKIVEMQHKFGYYASYREELNNIQDYLDWCEQEEMPFLREIRSSSGMIAFTKEVIEILQSLKKKMAPIFFECYQLILDRIIEIEQKCGYDESLKRNLMQILEYLDCLEQERIPELEAIRSSSEIFHFEKKIEERLCRLKDNIGSPRLSNIQEILMQIIEKQDNVPYDEAVKAELLEVHRFLDVVDREKLLSQEASIERIYRKKVAERLYKLKGKMKLHWFQHFDDKLNWIEQILRDFPNNKSLNKDLNLIQEHLDMIEQTSTGSDDEEQGSSAEDEDDLDEIFV